MINFIAVIATRIFKKFTISEAGAILLFSVIVIVAYALFGESPLLVSIFSFSQRQTFL